MKAFGSAATADGPIVLKRVAKKRFGHRVHANKGAKAAKAASALISGRVSDLSAATATVAGSLKVGGITLAIPAGKVLRARVAGRRPRHRAGRRDERRADAEARRRRRSAPWRSTTRHGAERSRGRLAGAAPDVVLVSFPVPGTQDESRAPRSQ